MKCRKRERFGVQHVVACTRSCCGSWFLTCGVNLVWYLCIPLHATMSTGSRAAGATAAVGAREGIYERQHQGTTWFAIPILRFYVIFRAVAGGNRYIVIIERPTCAVRKTARFVQAASNRFCARVK